MTTPLQYTGGLDAPGAQGNGGIRLESLAILGEAPFYRDRLGQDLPIAVIPKAGAIGNQ